MIKSKFTANKFICFPNFLLVLSFNLCCIRSKLIYCNWLDFSVTGGELFERIADDSFELTEQLAVVYLRQICEALSYMHSVNILHLDLKVRPPKPFPVYKKVF